MSRRRTRAILAAGVAVAAAGGTAAALGLGGGRPASSGETVAPPATAEVTKSTLVDEETVDGTLGYGTATTVSGKAPGTLTWLPGEGVTVRRGGKLYTVDNEPVVLLHGALPMYRRLAPGTEGADVKLLERNLAALGYDGFTVDAEYTDSTAAAMAEWQEDLGVEETGVLEPGRVVYAPGDVRVFELKTQVGDAASPGRPVLTYTGSTRVVTVELEVEQQRLAATGAAVTVELPGGKDVAGKVSAAEAVIDTGSQGEDPQTKLEVTVALPDQKALGSLDVATVEVTFVAARRENVLSVPVNALLALAEGGYGVQVVEGSATRIVPVELGLFSGGRVEVTGAGLSEGMTVGVAA